jgi:pyrimidine-nucleoside phosphorylase
MIGELAVDLGAGRAKKEDSIDYGVGIVVHAKVGDQVAAGDSLFTVHAADREGIETAREELLQAVVIKPEPTDPLPVFYDKLE